MDKQQYKERSCNEEFVEIGVGPIDEKICNQTYLVFVHHRNSYRLGPRAEKWIHKLQNATKKFTR